MYKLLLFIALVVLPAVGLQAQTYNDTIRTDTWSLYVSGGISNFLSLRGGSVTGVLSSISPDLGLGLKYNLNPGFRLGLNFGYTKIKAKNADIETSQTKTPGFQIGEYNDAELIVDKAVLVNRVDNHMAGADLNFDFNLITPFYDGNQRWNFWMGTGVGYLYGWTRNTVTTAITEEAIANGDSHFNIYNKDHIETIATFKRAHTLYIPARLSLEYDFMPRLTLGLKAEYKYLPLSWDFTPKGIWSANLTVSYNFATDRYSKNCIREHYEGVITGLNKNINRLKGEVSSLAGKNKDYAERNRELKNELDSRTASADAREKARQNAMLNSKSNIKPINSITTIAQLLIANPKAKVYIKGYSSSDGRAEYSEKLSGLHSDLIAEMLTKYFMIAPERVSTDTSAFPYDESKLYEYNRAALIAVTNLN